jgi:rod shape-determining protein MreD
MLQGNRRRADIYLALVILAFAVVVQGTLLSRLRILGITPNLLLVIVVSWSLARGVTEGLIWAFIGGLGVDLIAGLPVGTSSLALMPVCFLAGIGRNSVYTHSVFWPMLLVALATPLHGWIVLLILQFLGMPVDWVSTTVRVILPELILNILLTIPVYPGLRWMAAQLGVPVMEM